MRILDRVLEAIGFRPMVKIEGKDFFNLSLPEVALMIDNHLSLYHGHPEGIHRDLFDHDALFEFLVDYPNRNPELEQVRKRLLEIDERYRTPEQPDGFAFEGGQAEVRALAEALRRGEV